MSDQRSGNPGPSPFSSLLPGLSSPTAKLIGIGVLFLLMLIPAILVGELNKEREQRQTDVIEEFGSSWGPPQEVLGPVLVVPYRATPNSSRRYLEIAPSRLDAAATLSPEVRKRGLFHSVVYGADVALSGTFVIPGDLSSMVPSDQLLWQESFVALRATDLRALNANSRFDWDGRLLPWGDCAQFDGIDCGSVRFLVARLGLTAAPALETPIRFKTGLHLRGTRSFHLAPLGRDVTFRLTAPWNSPSFVGAMLPEQSAVGDGVFEAVWRLSTVVPPGYQAWTALVAFQAGNGTGARQAISDRIGVELLEPVPIYQKVDRASKYAALFLALSFLTYFLFETIARVRIHLVQYGLLGLSISLFGLLLLALSEPLGFELGYAASSLLVLSQASVYTAAVTRRLRHALTFAAALAALFGFLFVLLSLETYSLILGAGALFVGLSVLMAVTRHVDWSKTPAALLSAPNAEGTGGPS
jgi:inner membrane protein